MTDVASISEDLPIPVLVFASEDVRLSWINHAGQLWIGRSMKSLEGLQIEDIFGRSEKLNSVINKTLANRSAVTVSEMIVELRGSEDEKCQLWTFINGDNVGVCFNRLGRQTQKESVLDGSAALGRMLAHEIKNPLAGIRGAAQLLRLDLHNEEALSMIDLIESEIGRIRRLADRMERLGDQQNYDLQPVNIHEVLRHARKVVQSGVAETIAFTEDYDPSLPLALGDEDHLIQALLNLIKNATESLPDHSDRPEIRLETSYRASRSDLPIQIQIHDNGAGIAEHIRDKIFHPFVTDKPHGQGLGLSLVSKVIAAHNGIIEVQSRPGETIFSILLPAA